MRHGGKYSVAGARAGSAARRGRWQKGIYRGPSIALAKTPPGLGRLDRLLGGGCLEVAAGESEKQEAWCRGGKVRGFKKGGCLGDVQR